MVNHCLATQRCSTNRYNVRVVGEEESAEEVVVKVENM